MLIKFDRLIAKMPELLKELKNTPLLNRNDLSDVPKQGVYILYHKGKPVYVGRSNNIRSRIQQHSRPSSRHNSASLAFRIAKDNMSRNTAIPRFIKRKELEEAPGFAQEFFLARMMVANMKIRVIEITDQVEQALFEIYAALALKTTKYNEFSTH